MEMTIADSVPVITVLLQGFLSFFSPCVLPLLPLYIGYLSGGTGKLSPEGEERYSRKKVMINTIFFVMGISFAFFLLGLGMRAIGRFFSGNQYLFSRIGGILIVLFGLYQMGVFDKSTMLMKERRLPLRFDKMAMSPVTALLMGFVFSFAWTPCVGPTLSSVLVMAASAKSSAAGFLLVGVYTIGFAFPFLLTGIFTSSILNYFRKHKNFVKYTTKISGVLLVLMGVLMITGFMNSITGYLSRVSGTAENAVTSEQTAVSSQFAGGGNTAANEGQSSSAGERREVFPAPDFTLKDQYGKTHTLSDYKGKIVFLNFWATWCPPCRMEMPDIQAIYEETQNDPNSDVVILGVAFPNHGSEASEEGIKKFLDDNGYTYPVLMDHETGLMLPYYITAYPTTYMIDVNGNIFGYVPGSLTKDIMKHIIRQTRESVGKS